MRCFEKNPQYVIPFLSENSDFIMKKLILLCLVFVITNNSCSLKNNEKNSDIEDPQINEFQKPIDTTYYINNIDSSSIKLKKNKYSNLKFLEKEIENTDYSKDTIFLNFRMSMTKIEFEEHVEELKKQGEKIFFLKSKSFSSDDKEIMSREGMMDGRSVAISIELNLYEYHSKNVFISQGIKYICNGIYYIIPKFNKNGNLFSIQLIYKEKYNPPLKNTNKKWIHLEIFKNSSECKDKNLEELIRNYARCNYNSYVRKQNNVLIYENLAYIEYYDKKQCCKNIKFF